MNWLFSSWTDVLQIATSTLLILVAIIVVIRLNGLRSLSKMSSFDFSVTVAIGSILASTLLSDTVSVLDGVVGVVTLLFAQRFIAIARVKIGASRLVDNEPVVLMVKGKLLDHVLKKERVTPGDVYAKLREANVINLSEVYAVVLEATGDISVLHGSGKNSVDPRLLEGVDGGIDALQQIGST